MLATRLAPSVQSQMQLHPSLRLLRSTSPSHWPNMQVDWPTQDEGRAVQKGGGGPGPLLHDVLLKPPQHGMRRT
jgi:hypothetical protein